MPFGASRGPSYTRSKPKRADNVFRKSLKAVVFLNLGSKDELHLVEWILRGKKRSKSGDEKFRGSLTRNAWFGQQ